MSKFILSVALCCAVLASGLFAESNNAIHQDIVNQLKSAKANIDKLNNHLSGSVTFRGFIKGANDESLGSLTIESRNGVLNSWARLFGSRKTSYYKYEQITGWNSGIPTINVMRGPIDIEATAKGLAITFYSPSPDGVIDFNNEKLRTQKIMHIHVPHSQLYTTNGVLNVVLTGLKQEANFYEGGFFWAKEGELFSGISFISVSDQRISRAKEFARYTGHRVKNGVTTGFQAAGYVVGGTTYYALEAYKLLKSPAVYDAAMASAYLVVAGAELYSSLQLALMLNPLAFGEASRALAMLKNSFVHYEQFMGSSNDDIQAKLVYLESLELSAMEGVSGVGALIKAGSKISNLELSGLKDLAAGIRALKETYQAFGAKVAPAA